jgi:AcrR family transcriptional regulator
VQHHVKAMPRQASAEAVLDAALALAEEVGWGAVTARAIGERLRGGPDLVRAHYRDLDAIADAWFARALDVALAAPQKRGAKFPERLGAVINAWLDALAPHRKVSLEMIRLKLYPSHPHHWVPLIFNLSRLVQWMLDAAGSTSRGRRRQAEEIAVSALIFATLRSWQRGDDAATRRFVAARLESMQRRFDRVWPSGS